MRQLAAVVAAALLPAAASAQALSCAAPETIAPPRPDGPTDEQPRRMMTIGSFTLALTWSPQLCRTQGSDPDEAFRCASKARFGFTLHGLWPDGKGSTWPQYCRPAEILEPEVLASNLCATPSAQLLQHEWAKHGTCLIGGPRSYFNRARALYGRIRYPDMAMLAKRPMTVGRFAEAFAAANPGIEPAMIKVTTTDDGWLDELWLCLDTRLRYAACPPHQRNARPDAPLRIWTAPR